MDVAVNRSQPSLFVATVATARVAGRDADKDLMPLVVRRIEAACTEHARVIGAASLAAICRFAVLEDMTTRVSSGCGSVLSTFYCSLGIAKTPGLLCLGRQAAGEEERKVGIVAGEGTEENGAELAVGSLIESVLVATRQFAQAAAEMLLLG
jgi:hypothetical protein